MKNIINKHKSIIVLNGTVLHKKVIQFLNTDVPIIAADGAVNKLHRLDLKPTYIVGDGDSYQKQFLERDAKIVHLSGQDSTDFEKCIFFAQENNLFPSLVLGIGGGEIDHVLGNMQAFLKHAQNFNLYFIDTYKPPKDNLLGVKLGIPLTNKKLELELRTQCTISIIPFEKTIICSEGLYWELKDFNLMVDGILGVRNTNKENFVTCYIKQGRALFIVDVSNYWNDDRSSFCF